MGTRLLARRRRGESAQPGGESVTVEIKGQADVTARERVHLAFEENKFHVFGVDEKVIRHA